QLKHDGVLVAPIWLESLQVSAAFVVQPDGSLYSRTNIPCGFVPLRGIASGPNITRRVSGSTLTLSSNEAQFIDGASLLSLLSDDAETTYLSPSLSFSDYWRGFVPYLTLHMPEGFFFAAYSVGEQQKDFGLEGDGFALITRGSACFVRYQGKGEAHIFGGSDALMTLQASLNQWDQIGRPGADRVRIQLLPKDSAEPIEHPANTKVYGRPYNELRVWMET
ncbi:MAG: hypothetical protein ABI970_26165, partial [Chloroflexota bacterium]